MFYGDARLFNNDEIIAKKNIIIKYVHLKIERMNNF